MIRHFDGSRYSDYFCSFFALKLEREITWLQIKSKKALRFGCEWDSYGERELQQFYRKQQFLCHKTWFENWNGINFFWMKLHFFYLYIFTTENATKEPILISRFRFYSLKLLLAIPDVMQGLGFQWKKKKTKKKKCSRIKVNAICVYSAKKENYRKKKKRTRRSEVISLANTQHSWRKREEEELFHTKYHKILSNKT